MKKVLLVPLFAALLFCGSVSEAGARADSKITVSPWPGKGIFGHVESPKPARCADGRQVLVLKKSGGVLKRVATAGTTRSRSGFMWSVRGRKMLLGTFVARVAPSKGCKGDAARQIVAPRSGTNSETRGYPYCPSLEEVCYLSTMHITDRIDFGPDANCHGWGERRGYDYLSLCGSKVVGGTVPWCCWRAGQVAWNKLAATNKRQWWLRIKGNDGPDFFGGKTTVQLEGTIPALDSPRFYIDEASLPVWSDGPAVKWYTPDLGDSATTGEPGGPIYLNFEPEPFGSFEIYIGGFLYRK